jgi:hypothetical protein
MVPGKLIAENLKRVRQSIAEACLRRGRRPEAAALVAVVKSVGLDEIRALIDLGQTDLAENRPQQFAERVKALGAPRAGEGPPGSRLPASDSPTGESRPPAPVHWHFIGHLQRNKVKLVVPAAELIHSVDSLRLAEEIGKRAAAGQPQETGTKVAPVRVLLEINVSGEAAKDGVPAAQAEPVALQVAAVPNVSLCGLMTMAPRSESPEQARSVFAGLRDLFERLRAAHGGAPTFAAFQELSMGMSSDYVPAVEEGATLVRIGTALFE